MAVFVSGSCVVRGTCSRLLPKLNSGGATIAAPSTTAAAPSNTSSTPRRLTEFYSRALTSAAAGVTHSRSRLTPNQSVFVAGSSGSPSSFVRRATSSTSKTCAAKSTEDVKEIDAFVLCKKTKTLLPVPETLNYFDLFGLPEPTFKIDLKALGKKHKRLQTILHPDRFSLASEDQRALSDIWSPIVNEAYACLKKPVRRANYLLYLAGRPLHEGEEIGLDANFLAEIVELNEEIVEAEGPTEVAGLMTHVRDHLQTLFDKAEVAFDVDSDLDRARLVTAQIRYYENLKKKLVERETEFGMIR